MRPKPDSEAPSFFGFKDSTLPSASDAAFFMGRFSRRAAALLEDFQEWSAGRDLGTSASQDEGFRVGLGVYLLRSRHPLATNAAGKAGDRTGTRKPRKPPK
jgi:hypothetical protein